MTWRILLVCGLSLAPLPSGAALTGVNRRTPVVEAVEKSLPAVVNISTERPVRTLYSDPRMRVRGDLLDQFFSDFFGARRDPGSQVTHSLGSGVVVDEQGYILTNYHVIERASRIRVMLTDNTVQEATFLAGDEVSDLALIKIAPAKPLQAVEFAHDDDLMLGETVIALGNPYGLSHSVTVGVLSAKDREARYEGEVLFRDILQTDAAVNPGNSGGPLLNLDGDLIGINVAIYQQAQNIGFALPIKRARTLLARWMSPRLIKKTWVGFEPAYDGTSVRVAAIDPGGPAEKAGLPEGAIVLEADGHPVADVFALNRVLLPFDVGATVRLTVSNAPASSYALVVAPLPKPSGAALVSRLLGMEFQEDLTGAGVPRNFRSCLPIRSVAPGGPAAKAGLAPGLLVMRINDTDIRTLDDVGLALEHVQRGDMVTLQLVQFSERESFIVAQTTAVNVLVL